MRPDLTDLAMELVETIEQARGKENKVLVAKSFLLAARKGKKKMFKP